MMKRKEDKNVWSGAVLKEHYIIFIFTISDTTHKKPIKISEQLFTNL